MEKFDVGIIGMGIAGTFACLKLSESKLNIIAFDSGAAPQKRRTQMSGYLGLLPNGDGKIYLNNIDDVSNITNSKRTSLAKKYFDSVMSNVGEFKTENNKSPKKSVIKRFNKFGYDVVTNEFIQILPKDVHTLSRYSSSELDKDNITFKFNEDVISIRKNGNEFEITTDYSKYTCSKIILAVGRSGWKWAGDIFSELDIIDNNNTANFGVMVELEGKTLKDYNNSNCNIFKDKIKAGPLLWGGTIIPEDHVDMAISSFRSNEARWKTDNVSFSLMAEIQFDNNAYQQLDRIGQVSFIVNNERIVKEKTQLILNGKNKLSIMPEFNFLKDVILDFAQGMPEILEKSYCHTPTMQPLAPKIKLGSNLESEIDGMFVVGESCGCIGILSAALTGIIAANSIR